MKPKSMIQRIRRAYGKMFGLDLLLFPGMALAALMLFSVPFLFQASTLLYVVLGETIEAEYTDRVWTDTMTITDANQNQVYSEVYFQTAVYHHAEKTYTYEAPLGVSREKRPEGSKLELRILPFAPSWHRRPSAIVFFSRGFLTLFPICWTLAILAACLSYSVFAQWDKMK